MKVLIVSYHYLPVSAPRALRWSAISEYWADMGISVDLVCGARSDSLPQETLRGVNVYRTGATRFAAWREKLNKVRNQPIGPGANGVSNGGRLSPKLFLAGAVRALKRVYNFTYRNLYWPDVHWAWYFSARKKALSLARNHHYSAIITVSHPFTAHWVGLYLHRRLPNIPWIVDIGDPFCILSETPTNNHSLYRALNERVERKVFRQSHAISVTTPETSAEYARIFPESAQKVKVIPPLLSPQFSRVVRPEPAQNENAFRLIFIGTFYKSIRNPSFLLKLFEAIRRDGGEFEKAELHIYGEMNDCAECFDPYAPLIGKSIFLHGMVNHAGVARAMRDADVLINIGNRTHYQLPSKVVEYASSGKPVLNLYQSPLDSSVAFFRNYGGAWNCQNSDEGPSTEQVDEFRGFLSRAGSWRDQWDEKKMKEFLSPFFRESIAEAYLDSFRPYAGEKSIVSGSIGPVKY